MGAFQIHFPLPAPPHLEEGCPRSGRGGGGVPAQQAGWFCVPPTTPRLRRTPPPKGGGDCSYVSSHVSSYVSSYRRRASDDLGDLFRDPGLAVLVVDERELVDQGLGV